MVRYRPLTYPDLYRVITGTILTDRVYNAMVIEIAIDTWIDVEKFRGPLKPWGSMRERCFTLPHHPDGVLLVRSIEPEQHCGGYEWDYFTDLNNWLKASRWTRD